MLRETCTTSGGIEGGYAHGEGAALSPPLERIGVDIRPTLLLAGEAARTGVLARWAGRAGLRVLGAVAPAQLPGRLAQVAMVDLVLLDLRDADPGAEPDQAQARAIAMRQGLCATRLAVITDLAGLDRAMAQMEAPGVEFLCDPADSDIVTLLVMAGLAPARGGPAHLHDSTRESEAARIERLSEEVRRLAVTIERLAGPGLMSDESASVMAPRSAYRAPQALEALVSVPPAPAGAIPPARARTAASSGSAQPLTHADVRAIIRARRMRDHFLPADLFADPAWDMMLDLLAAHLSGQRVSVSSLCIASAVPPTTALRWIRQLTDRAVFARIDDPADGRRVFIELTDDAARALTAWAQAVRGSGGLLAPGR